LNPKSKNKSSLLTTTTDWSRNSRCLNGCRRAPKKLSQRLLRSMALVSASALK